MFILSASCGHKPQFWANFDILGAPVLTPFYRRRPNLVCYRSRLKCTLTGPISSECVHCVGFCSSVGQKPQFSANFDIFGSSCSDPLYRRGTNLVSYSRPSEYVYLPHFISIGVFCRPVAAKNTQFCRFWTSAFSDVANWHQSQKVEHCAQPQTFPYPTVSKSFLYSNASMAKSGAQSLTFKSVTNRQTNRQTNKQEKTQRSWLPGGG